MDLVREAAPGHGRLAAADAVLEEYGRRGPLRPRAVYTGPPLPAG